jgi:serine protease inhibitor
MRLLRIGLAAAAVGLLLSGCGRSNAEAASVPQGPMPQPDLPYVDNDFGFRLLGQLTGAAPGTNVFISPASVALALQMTYNGAAGETKTAMAKALGIQGVQLSQLNEGNRALLAQCRSEDPKIQLSLANSLWARQGFRFEPDFLAVNREFYDATVDVLDFGDPKARDTINGWVAEKTGGQIAKLIDEIPALTVMYLVNAAYFHGQWQTQFDEKATKVMPFHAPGGDVPHPMMTQEGDYGHLQGDGFEAVSLPYSGGRVSMYIFLPSAETGLAGFLKKLNADNWQSWVSSFRTGSGTVTIPRFRAEYSALLNEPLKALGMGVAFDVDKADFSGMTGKPDLYISRVLHKTFVEVNEEGTEAAGATAVEMTLKGAPSKPFTFIADRPFFYAIRDNETGAILFMGVLVNPS